MVISLYVGHWAITGKNWVCQVKIVEILQKEKNQK